MNGCLVIHGLTGTPGTVAILHDALLAAGFRVSAPCLAGHGTDIEELSRSTWEDWYATVRVAFEALRRDVDRVYCAGISLGALLALKLALDEGWGVRALALMSTPLRFSLLNRMAVPAVRYSPLRWLLRAIPKDMESSVADPEGRARYEELSLPMIPTSSVFEISRAQRELRGKLGRVTSPVLLLHGAHDTVAPLENVGLVKDAVSSDIVETIILPRSRHVITMDYEKDRVAMETMDFFHRFA